MVRIEFRTTILGYNLIRLTAASAALRSKQKPRTISFTISLLVRKIKEY